MKRQAPNVLSNEVWTELETLFWNQQVPLPSGTASWDGFDIDEVESTKRGVEIRGGIWVLPGGPGSPNPRYDLHLCLARPRFSSIASVSVDKLKGAVISGSKLEGSRLYLTIE